MKKTNFFKLFIVFFALIAQASLFKDCDFGTKSSFTYETTPLSVPIYVPYDPGHRDIIRVNKFYVSDGSRVNVKQNVIELEYSGTGYVDLVAPISGTIKMNVSIGDVVAQGAIIAHVTPNSSDVDIPIAGGD